MYKSENFKNDAKNDRTLKIRVLLGECFGFY